MKKLVLTSVCALAMAGAAFAQGTLNWNSFSPAAITVQTNSAVYSPLFGGGAAGGVVGTESAAASSFFYTLLFQGPASGFGSWSGAQIAGGSAPSNSFASLFGGTWHDSGANAVNASSGGITGNPLNTGLTVPWANGTTNNIILVGWSANLGSTWAVVSNLLATSTYAATLAGAPGFFGVSAAGFINPATGTPGAVVFGTAASASGLPIRNNNMQLYLLPTIPEPTTMALAGLGGLSLLLFRRRK